MLRLHVVASSVALLAAAGCPSEILEPGTGGSAPQGTTSATTSLSTGTGGADLPPVVGCETLVLSGEKVIVPAYHPHTPRLFAAGPGTVGLVYTDRDEAEEV